MSWAEDNGIDVWDVEDTLEFQRAIRESNWREGFHETKDGRELKISEMTTEHLENTIKHFKTLDTTPLKLELLIRQKSA